MGKHKGKPPGGAAKKTTQEIFLRLFPFVRESLRSLFAFIVALFVVIVPLLTASAFMSGKLEVVALIVVCVLFVLLLIAGSLYLWVEAVHLYRGLFPPTPPPLPPAPAPLPPAALPLPMPLTIAEKAIIDKLFALVKGGTAGAKPYYYLAQKLSVPHKDLVDVLDRFRQ